MLIIPAVVVPKHPEIPRELYNQCIGCHRGRTLAIFHRKGRNPRQLYLVNIYIKISSIYMYMYIGHLLGRLQLLGSSSPKSQQCTYLQ